MGSLQSEMNLLSYLVVLPLIEKKRYGWWGSSYLVKMQCFQWVYSDYWYCRHLIKQKKNIENEITLLEMLITVLVPSPLASPPPLLPAWESAKPRSAVRLANPAMLLWGKNFSLLASIWGGVSSYHYAHLEYSKVFLTLLTKIYQSVPKTTLDLSPIAFVTPFTNLCSASFAPRFTFFTTILSYNVS